MKVLVVDDDAVGRLVASTVVDTLGHEVSTAVDGEDAWRQMTADHFDVVVSDVAMPGVDGLELCRRLRADGADAPGRSLGRPDAGYTYLILLTGHDEFPEALAGMEAGADDYLGKPLSPDELHLRLVAAQRVTDVHRQLRRQQRELMEHSDAQHTLARRDPLTGLPNRRALDELDRLDAQARRNSPGYSLALLDLDHFRSYNEAVGHVAGDRALRQVADVLRAHVRETDGLYRYGEEVIVHVAHTGSSVEATAAVERLRRAVQDLALPHPGRPGQTLTLTAGLARRSPGRLQTHAVLGAADSALHAAKRTGRNRTAEADDVRTPDALSRAAAPAVAPDEGLPVLDPGPLDRMHGVGRRIGRDLAGEIVDTYRTQLGERLAALQTAYDTRDDAGLARTAHGLKASSASVGATRLSQLCAELQQAHLWPRRGHLLDEVQTAAAAASSALVQHVQTLARV